MPYTEIYIPLCRYSISDGRLKWCCHTEYFKSNFINWTSGNDKIDNSIREAQEKARSSDKRIFEWIPYDQFDDIKETEDNPTIYSATWKDGPLRYDSLEKKL